MKITFCTIACSTPPHTPYLWPGFVYLPPHRCSPFISCSGIPVKASPWLVSWTMMDTGGQRKCPHGWDQSTVLGLWQWPWRLIISSQKCSFMLLISCKLVSLAFLLKQFPSPPLSPKIPMALGMIRNLWSVISAALVCAAVTLIDNLKEGSLWDKTLRNHLQGNNSGNTISLSELTTLKQSCQKNESLFKD